MITLMTMPLRLAVKLLGFLGPNMLENILLFKMINGVLPITNGIIAFNTMLIEKNIVAQIKNIFTGKAQVLSIQSISAAYAKLALSQAGVTVVLFAMIAAIRMFAKDSPLMAAGIGTIAGAILGLALAIQVLKSTKLGPVGFLAIVGATMAAFAGLGVALQKIMEPPKVESFAVGGLEGESKAPDFSQSIYDTGGRIPMYETGGPRGMGLGSRHKTVMVEPGETIIPKTQNMLGGAGITLNIGGDIVTNDAEDFAARVATVLPEALRKQNDMGGI
jgi:hypothetical protein